MDHASDAIKYMLEVVGSKPFYDYTQQSGLLPVWRKLQVTEIIDHAGLMGMDARQRENYIRATITRELASLLTAPGVMDLRKEVDLDRFAERITGSVYVFNEEQMQSFIRDIEDAVKENMAQ